MNEYISKQKVLDYLNGYLHSLGDDPDTLFDWGQRIALKNSIQDISAIKAADVQPVRRGRWSECYTDSRLYSGICSVCGGAAIRSVIANPLGYCPNCGARMDGDTK